MKKFIKKILVLMTSAALAFGFASCGSGDDDNSSGGGGSNSALAVFTCNSGYDTRTLTFYNDSTFKVIVSGESEPQAAGTYKFVSGNWENGTISLNATSGEKQETFTGTKTISEKKIIFSSKTYILTGGTLKTPSDKSGNSGKEPAQTEKNLIADFRDHNQYSDSDYIISFYSNNTFEFKYSDSDYNKESGTYSLVGNWNNGCVAIKNSSTSNYPKIESGVYVISDGVVKIYYYDFSVKEIASGADKNVFPEMVYFPDNEEYSEKKIVGLFITNDETSESNKIYLGKIATFFFSDNTWLSTKKADSASGIQTSVLNTGTYTGEIDMNKRSYSSITFASEGHTSSDILEKDEFGRVFFRGISKREYRFDADVFVSKAKYINYDKVAAVFSAPEKKGDNYTKEKLYVFYDYDNSTGKCLYELLSILTSGEYTNINILESSKYSKESGDWSDGSIKISDSWFASEIKNRVLTINGDEYTRSYPEYKDTTAANGSAAFAATIFGRKYVVKFDNGTYVQYENGKEDGKGTYTMTGDFTNGTMRLVETAEYKNGSWKTKSEIIDCTITNGTLKNKYGSFSTISYDYDVSQDLPDSTGDNNQQDSEGFDFNATNYASASLKSKLPASVGTNQFAGTTYKYSDWSDIVKIVFKDDIMAFYKNDKPYKSYYYSYDTENKRLSYVFRTIWRDGKEYTDIDSYVKRENSFWKKYSIYPNEYIEVLNKSETIWFEQVQTVTYEETSSGIKIEKYFTGNFPDISFGEFYTRSGDVRIEGKGNGDQSAIRVVIPAYYGSGENYDYSKSSAYGAVTSYTGNKLTCTVTGSNSTVVGNFTVEVTATPSSGNDAIATIKIISIDDDVKFLCGQSVGAVFEGLKYSSSFTSNESSWKKM